MFKLFTAMLLLVTSIVTPFQLQVSHISCINKSEVEVHFTATNSSLDLSSSQVDFVMNGVPYVAPYTKYTGDAYHFATVITSTQPVTYTITQAYIQYDQDTRVDAHNLDYNKYVNCNPTGITLIGISVETVTPINIIPYLIASTLLAIAVIVIYRIIRKK
jgi:hypothetical protein